MILQRYMRYSCLFEIMPSYVQETSRKPKIPNPKWNGVHRHILSMNISVAAEINSPACFRE